jgi:hypothetical protein
MNGTKWELAVRYGMAAPCTAVLDDEEVVNIPARTLVGKVARIKQEMPPAQRAATVLRDVLSSGRAANVEVTPNDADVTEPGRPVNFDDILVTSEKDRPETGKLNLRVTEAYRGG